MGFYAALNVINTLLSKHQWQLRRCRRRGDDNLHYFVTDPGNRVVTPTYGYRRTGLTLDEILNWLERAGDKYLSEQARALRLTIDYRDAMTPA